MKDRAKTTPMVEPMIAIDLERWLSRVRSAAMAMATSEIAPAPCRMRPAIMRAWEFTGMGVGAGQEGSCILADCPMETIRIRGARTHNLRNVSLDIPRNRLVVVTGLSGSGKSSLAFDTLYAEGQRRYVESLSAYARQFLQLMEKPDVDLRSEERRVG